jgi:hypothetical protein
MPMKHSVTVVGSIFCFEEKSDNSKTDFMRN